jgi:hypothetical protein
MSRFCECQKAKSASARGGLLLTITTSLVYSHLAPESLLAAIQSLRSLAEARTSGRSRDFLTGGKSRFDLSGRPLSPAYDEAQQPYDPACVFDLEVMISLASKSPEHIAETWWVAPGVADRSKPFS